MDKDEREPLDKIQEVEDKDNDNGIGIEGESDEEYDFIGTQPAIQMRKELDQMKDALDKMENELEAKDAIISELKGDLDDAKQKWSSECQFMFGECQKQCEEKCKEEVNAKEKKIMANVRLLTKELDLLPKLNDLLKSAVNEGNTTKVSELLGIGANVNSVDDAGHTLLHSALKENNVELVKLLVANGVDLEVRDKQGWRPLSRAARDGKAEMVHAMLQADGASELFANSCAAFALHWAVYNSHIDVVKTLLEHSLKKYGRGKTKALVNSKGASNKSTALHYAHSAGDTNVEIVKLLEECGADPKVKNNSGKMPAEMRKAKK